VPRPVEIWSSAIVWHGRPARLVTTRGLPGVAHEDELSAITLAAGVPVGMVSVRADGAVAWCNRAARALLGDGAEIDALDAVRGRIHPDDRPAWLSGGAADAAPVGDVAHVRIVQRDGTVVPVGLHLLPLGAAAAGDPRPFVLTLIDRREVERARALAQEGTARTAQHQRLESLGTLAAGLAHEVRNVLGVIMGSAELLALPGTTAAESGELAGAIREAAQHGADLVASALVFAQPGPRGAPEWTPVAHHLDAAIALVDAGHRDAPLRRFLDPRAVDTPLDAAAVTQLVLNTVHNARRALGGRADGWVSISTRPLDFAHAVTTRTGPIDAGRYLGVWVRDNGAGIAPAHLSRLFEPFFTTERERGGTGLGLSGISGLLRRVGGGADVHSEPGVGTTFAFYLPARLHDPQTTTPPAERPPHVLVVSHRLRRKRDIEAALQAAGLTVEAHASPRVAIARLAAAHDPIDAVWVEYELGEWTGADFAREAVLQGVSLPPMVLAAPPGLALDPSRIAPGALVHLVPSTLEGAALPAAVTAALAG
jgi:signal transduction histidine kinase